MGLAPRWCFVLSLVGCAPKTAESPDPEGGAATPPATAPAKTAARPDAPPPTADARPPEEPEPKAPDVAATLEMTFVGDIIFGRYRGSGFDPIPEDGFQVFDEIKPKLASDMLVGNLETPLVRDLPLDSPIGSKYRFGASPEHAQHLVSAGFTAVSLANNHWYDQRVKGIDESPPILRELGIVPLGAAVREGPVFRAETVEKNGWKVAFVAFTTRTNAPVREGGPVLPYLETSAIKTTIAPVVQAARDGHDLVIAFVHWGDEYAEGPNITQVKAAHSLIDAGADMVIGHHPHVLQGVERYGKGLIAYSLGNFLFENTNAIPRLTGVLRVKARRDGACVEKVVLHPAYIKRQPVPHPVPASGALGRQVRDRAIGQAKKLDTTWTIDGEDLVLEKPGCE
jgi:hypothetical protein